MWFDELGEVYEMFRGSFPLSFLLFVPLVIMVSPVGAAQDFTVYRMQHYDLHGSPHGCRNAIVNVEARLIDASVYTRRCVISRLRQLTISKFKDIQAQNAGGLLILIPSGPLEKEDKKYLLELEEELLLEETNMPVYFTYDTPEVSAIYEDIKTSQSVDTASSALSALMGSVSANGFQMVMNGPQAKVLSDFPITNILGKLSGYGIEEQLPTITIVTHYDSFGIAPGLATGADSNGSGVVALLEIARIFSKLYSNSRTHAKYNILFLLSGGGKFNYQGTKKWIDENIEISESSLLSDVKFVLCLDTLGSGSSLNMHVSKPPKEGSDGDIIFNYLKESASKFSSNTTVDMVHKKINLAEDILAWEHERFSIRRLPAYTLSHLNTHKNPLRTSIVDTRASIDVSVLVRNIKIIAESLARYIFNLTQHSDLQLFQNSLRVDESLVESNFDMLTASSRAAQVLDKNHVLLSTLEVYLSHYVKDVQRSIVKAEKRDPDFVFYDGAQYTMHAYNVKPAIFDLFIALGIVGYLGLVYLLGQNFNSVYAFYVKRMQPKSTKA